MVVEPDEALRDVTEAVLAGLRFAVVPVESIEQALSLSRAIRPSVIVCAESDASTCHALLSIPIPVVRFVDPADALIERIREAIRAARVVRFESAGDH